MAKQTSSAFRQALHSVAGRERSRITDRELLHQFAAEGDQAAFAALVRRHTPMVFGVCQRTLANVQDAEDACQATFLVLLKKAKTGRWQSSVANWLYATARNVAGNARQAAQRRAQREGQAGVLEAIAPVDRLSGR